MLREVGLVRVRGAGKQRLYDLDARGLQPVHEWVGGFEKFWNDHNGRMDKPGFDVLGFLNEPLRPASVATVTARGRPALAMMWFVLVDGRLWFHTPDDEERPSPFLRAAAEGREVAVMVATFNPPDVRQVRVSGPARLEAGDDARVHAIYGRYIDAWTPEWEEQASSAGYRLWSMSPDRGMAVTYPGLEDRPAFRWSEPWM